MEMAFQKDLTQSKGGAQAFSMGMILKLVWFSGGCAALGLILWSGAGPVFGAVATAGWGVLAVVVLRGVAVSAAGIAWFFLFPAGLRPSAWTCVLIRFLREGANALLPITQVGGEVIGARVLTLRGVPPLALGRECHRRRPRSGRDPVPVRRRRLGGARLDARRRWGPRDGRHRDRHRRPGARWLLRRAAASWAAFRQGAAETSRG